MNKLGKREYIQLICESLIEEYGDDIVAYNTDLKIAKDILKKLTPYLYFHPHDMSVAEFKKWRKELYADLGIE
jgi:hypothetical protein